MPPSELKNIFDLVIVGGGIAGLMAGTRAVQLGLRVAVLEKGPLHTYQCNSRITSGYFHVGMEDINCHPDALFDVIQSVTNGYADEALARTLAADIRPAVDWLHAHGIEFVRTGPEGFASTVMSPPAAQQTGLRWKGRCGDVLLRTLLERLTEQGGEFLPDTRARRLMMDDDRCVGVEAINNTGPRLFSARSVLIADGGFQGDIDRLRSGISNNPAKLLQRNAGSAIGDGLKMAQKVGAKALSLNNFYGHLQHRRALTDKEAALWPNPILDSLATAGFIVDGTGKRFCDEGEGGINIANAVAKLDDPASAVVVFDQPIWESAGRANAIPANPNLVEADAEVIEARDISALACAAGIEPKVLTATVASYNKALGQSALDFCEPRRSLRRHKAYAIETPPFFAIRVCAGITYTLGGIATDNDGRVLHQDGQPITGLFAAGATTGGLEGGQQAGYVGGLAIAAVFALRAAECVARSLASGAA